MAGKLTMFKKRSDKARRRRLRPLLVGFAMTVFMVVMNHFIFFGNAPDLQLDVFDRDLVARDSGGLSANHRPPGFFSNLMYGFSDLVRTLDSRAIEVMQSIGSSGAVVSTEDKIAVITIDEASLNRIGSWPWPRRQVARIMSKLKEAKAVGFRIHFRPAPGDVGSVQGVEGTDVVFQGSAVRLAKEEGKTDCFRFL